jgi:uncharacterized protein (DUF2345 family)
MRPFSSIRFLALPLLLSACATATAMPTPRVMITSPANGATVSSPVHVTLGAENFVVEPAGEVKVGAGHLHIMVDAACIAPGQIIPKDAQHLHYGTGQMEADLELTPGAHTLCLQAADGAHTALSGDGLTQTINITVE